METPKAVERGDPPEAPAPSAGKRQRTAGQQGPRSKISKLLPHPSAAGDAPGAVEWRLSTEDAGDFSWILEPRWQLEAHMGGGTYGQVCKAKDTLTGKLVAIKQVWDVTATAEILKRTAREVALLARLEHHNVVQLRHGWIYTSPPQEDLPKQVDVFLAFELLEHGDLRGLLDSHTLELGQVRRLMQGILSGVQYLHSVGICHRDLKPENILITSHQSPKIADLGLARHCGTGRSIEDSVNSERGINPSTKLQRTCSLDTFTPCYRAPEVLVAAEYDASVDIWASGCILFELMQSPYGLKPRQLFHTSPAAGPGSTLTEMVQMLGAPPAQVVSTLASKEWREFFQQFKPSAGLLSEQCLVRASPPMDLEAVDLLHRMLHFSPLTRATALEALSHSFINAVDDVHAAKTSQDRIDSMWNEFAAVELEVSSALESEAWEEKMLKAIERDLAVAGMGHHISELEAEVFD